MHLRLPRHLDALEPMFTATREFYDRAGVAREDALVIDFALEELFVNLVRHQPDAGGTIEVELRAEQDVVLAQLTAAETRPFDPASAPDADVHAPLAARRPGGLGLHLTRRLVERLEHVFDGGVGQTRFRRTLRRVTPGSTGS